MVYSQNLLDKLELDADEIISMKMSQNEAKYPGEVIKVRSFKVQGVARHVIKAL